MAQFDYRAGKLSPELQKMAGAVRKAIAGWDYDSGWIATPTTKTVKHGLVVTPGFVQVYSSALANGSTYAGATATSVSATEIGFSGVSAAYVRIFADK